MWGIACGELMELSFITKTALPDPWVNLFIFRLSLLSVGLTSDFSSPLWKSLVLEPEPPGGAINDQKSQWTHVHPPFSNYASTSQNARAPLGLTHFKFISNWLGKSIRAACSVWPKSLQLSLSSTKREKLFAPREGNSIREGWVILPAPCHVTYFLKLRIRAIIFFKLAAFHFFLFSFFHFLLASKIKPNLSPRCWAQTEPVLGGKKRHRVPQS